MFSFLFSLSKRFLTQPLINSTIQLTIVLIMSSLGCTETQNPEEEMASSVISTEPIREMQSSSSSSPVSSSNSNTNLDIVEPVVISSIEERVGQGDVGPLNCSGIMCPTARISSLRFPRVPAESEAGGCRLIGDKNGTGIGAIIAIAGSSLDLNSYLSPERNDEKTFLLINHLTWSEGTTSAEAGLLRSTFYNGVNHSDSIFIEEGNPPTKPYSEQLSIENGLYSSPPSEFAMRFPITGLDVPVKISHAEMSAYLTLDSTGFNLTEGILAGYFRQEAILGLLEALHQACQIDTSRSCQSINSVLSGDFERDLELLTNLMGGYDTFIDEAGTPQACVNHDEIECNAVSVCLFFEMESILIDGIE